MCFYILIFVEYTLLLKHILHEAKRDMTLHLQIKFLNTSMAAHITTKIKMTEYSYLFLLHRGILC